MSFVEMFRDFRLGSKGDTLHVNAACPLYLPEQTNAEASSQRLRWAINGHSDGFSRVVHVSSHTLPTLTSHRPAVRLLVRSSRSSLAVFLTKEVPQFWEFGSNMLVLGSSKARRKKEPEHWVEKAGKS